MSNLTQQDLAMVKSFKSRNSREVYTNFDQQEYVKNYNNWFDKVNVARDFELHLNLEKLSHKLINRL